MNVLVALPLLVPFFTAVGLLFLWSAPRIQRAASVAGALALLGAGAALLAEVSTEGIQTLQVGGWPAPFGITLVADLFSAVMVALAGLMGSMVAIYDLSALDLRRASFGYRPLQHVMLLGVSGAFVTGDLLNLYVWFEVMLVASFALLVLGGGRAQLSGAIKYVTLNLMSSALFLTALGVLYGLIGTLNMADASRVLSATPPAHGAVVAMLLFAAFGIKAAVFPLFFWLPASYPTPPVPVTALFAALLTKVAVYAMVRVFTLLFVHDEAVTRPLLLAIGGATMVTGVLGAAAQKEIRRILSFHIISQIGYMIMGLGLFTRLALAGVVSFIAHNILVKSNLLLITGVIERRRGTDKLSELGGLYRASPGISCLFAISALSLAGLPPLSGFWAKLVLVRAGLEVGEYAIIAAALVTSLLTLFSMTKIWTQAFWAPEPDAGEAGRSGAASGGRAPPRSGEMALFLPVLVLTAATVLFGVFAEPVLALCARAAEQLLRREDYVRAVLEPEG